MKYKYLTLFVVLLMTLFLLCDCHSMRESIRILTDLPEQMQIHILLPMNITEQTAKSDSEIKQYNSDVFYCAEKMA